MNISEILKLYPSPEFTIKMLEYELYIIHKYLSKNEYIGLYYRLGDDDILDEYEDEDYLKFYTYSFNNISAQIFFEEYNKVNPYRDPNKKETVFEYEKSKLVLYGNKFLLLEHI